MNNSVSPQKHSKTILYVIIGIISSITLMICGYFFINLFIQEEADPSSVQKQERNAMPKVLKDGGSLIVFSPDVESHKKVSSEDIETAKLLVRSRLDSMGFPEATVETDRTNSITVAIPGYEITSEEVNSLKSPGKLEFLNADGNVIMTGSAEFLTGAKHQYEQLTEYGESQHYIELSFTEEGRKKFKEATQAAVAAGGEKQYISVALDGVLQMSPTVNEVIDSNSCVLTGDYTSDSAKDVANLINSGQLPFSLKTVKLEYVEPQIR